MTPLKDGDHMFLFVTEGMVEVLFTPEDAAHYERNGIVVDGRRLAARRVDVLPDMNGVLLRVEL